MLKICIYQFKNSDLYKYNRAQVVQTNLRSNKIVLNNYL